MSLKENDVFFEAQEEARLDAELLADYEEDNESA